MSGDEFLIVSEGLTQQSDVNMLADNIIEQIKEPITVEYQTLSVSASIGISFYPNNAENVKNLLLHADVAMYSAKKEGRDRYTLYENKKYV